MEFREFIRSGIVLLDGGTGALLQERGLPAGTRPEVWNITNPDAVTDIHRQYYEAGSNIVNTNTFGANKLNFSEEELDEIIRCAVENVRRARDTSSGSQPKFISYDIGPTGKMLAPLGDLPFEEAVSIFAFQAKKAEQYGADLISIETMADSYETKAALLAVKENTSLPVFVTNAYSEDGRLLTGAEPGAMVAMLEGLGADAIGLNCSYGPDKLMPVIRQIAAAASVPVIFKPNAGLPGVCCGKTVYDIDAATFASLTADACDYGVSILGGCCGTTPEYIRLLKEKTASKTFTAPVSKNICSVSCGTHALYPGKTPLVIGERINPTGKKLVKQALKDRDFDYLVQEGLAQVSSGADILDVNCGLAEIDEKETLTLLVDKLQSVCPVPLQIDTADISAMEAAMRLYNGKPLINSVSGRQDVMDGVFPLMKKYGGTAVALTLDENGIPESARERADIARRIIERAAEYGIDKSSLIFDPLCMSVSADGSAAATTLEAVKIITDELGCLTVLGVSNVSFGLPGRNIINSVFFTLALQNGLSCAILNPQSAEMMNALHSYLALTGRDKNCLGYIDYMTANPGEKSGEKVREPSPADIAEAITGGRADRAAELAEKYIGETGGMSLVNDYIIPALDETGRRFEKKEAFLPQLMLSAEAAKACFEVVQKHSEQKNGEGKYAVVIATVKGDVHDIGKNIVTLLLGNYGYQVTDLGKDVSKETIVETAKETGAKLIGLSALMTTTVPAMEEAIRYIRQELPGVKIIVGGAVLTQELADSMGADAYGPDAMATVRYAETLE